MTKEVKYGTSTVSIELNPNTAISSSIGDMIQVDKKLQNQIDRLVKASSKSRWISGAKHRRK